MPSQPQCRFALRIDPHKLYRCPHPAEGHGLCIFHMMVRCEESPEEWNVHLTAWRLGGKIRQQFLALITQVEGDEDCHEHDFRGFRLPDIDLRRTRFSKRVNFSEARFYGECVFSEAEFNDSVSFMRAQFRGSADFCSTLMKRADFEQASFAGCTDFYDSVFECGAHFTQATCSGELLISHCDFDGGVDFSHLKLPGNAQVTFDGLDLSRADFHNTDLERIVFTNITWYRDGRSRALRNEFEEGKDADTDYESVAANYRQLVLNHERKRDYDAAEDFHVGEMEVRRKKLGAGLPQSIRPIRRFLSLLNAYRLFSGYGTSYGRAALWLAVWVVTFAALFLLNGFQVSKESIGTPIRIIEYNLFADAHHHLVPLSDLFTDYAAGTLFTMSILTFQKERFYEPVGCWSQLLVVLCVLVVTTQAALTLLAIRRRFKR